jgi:plasmid stabilization system protein ParE
MSRGLMSIARGALGGAVKNRDRAEERRDKRRSEEREDFSTLLEIYGNDAVVPVDDSVQNSVQNPVQNGAPNGAAAPPRSPMAVARATVGGMQLGIDPTRSTREREKASRKAAHARLQKLDPDVWGEDFDDDFDYTEAEREERRVRAVEGALRTKGYSEADAKLIGRHNIDVEAREDRRASTARERQRFQNEQEDRTEGRSTREAAGLAQEWATKGHELGFGEAEIVSRITEALGPVFPKMTRGARAAVAAKAASELALSRATITQKTKSGKTRIGGLDIDLDDLDAETPATGRTTSGKTATKQPSENDIIDQLIEQGLTDQQIAAELKKRGF